MLSTTILHDLKKNPTNVRLTASTNQVAVHLLDSIYLPVQYMNLSIGCAKPSLARSCPLDRNSSAHHDRMSLCRIVNAASTILLSMTRAHAVPIIGSNHDEIDDFPSCHPPSVRPSTVGIIYTTLYTLRRTFSEFARSVHGGFSLDAAGKS
ncbi:hypothetical protein SCHPADRAFT_628944 [Schizopora paradoxa]|uniref:Uncharacterized protein n=1 Tax=Schizopora paradoxa TaxID=27342 RepID=A0A0H2RED1_9AGAM|nr:hypothetical protein SCHPADRAFT_628944 [Schizopora paradoxa]